MIRLPNKNAPKIIAPYFAAGSPGSWRVIAATQATAHAAAVQTKAHAADLRQFAKYFNRADSEAPSLALSNAGIPLKMTAPRHNSANVSKMPPIITHACHVMLPPSPVGVIFACGSANVDWPGEFKGHGLISSIHPSRATTPPLTPLNESSCS